MGLGFAPTLYSYNVVVIATGSIVDIIEAGSLKEAQEEFKERGLDPEKYEVRSSIGCPESMKK